MPKFRYSGPPIELPTLDRTVVNGDIVETLDDRLRHTQGFTEITSEPRALKEEPKKADK